MPTSGREKLVKHEPKFSRVTVFNQHHLNINPDPTRLEIIKSRQWSLPTDLEQLMTHH